MPRLSYKTVAFATFLYAFNASYGSVSFAATVVTQRTARQHHHRERITDTNRQESDSTEHQNNTQSAASNQCRCSENNTNGANNTASNTERRGHIKDPNDPVQVFIDDIAYPLFGWIVRLVLTIFAYIFIFIWALVKAFFLEPLGIKF